MQSKHDSRGFKVPNEWSFDEGVVPVLNDMMARSIPGYGAMRNAIATMAAAHIQCQDISLPRFLDVGCATGEGYSDLSRSVVGDGDYFGIDNSQPMIDHCLRRWSVPLSSGLGGEFRASFFHHDIAGDEPLEELGIGGVDIALCVLTMHFVPETRRRYALKKIYESMTRYGMFLFVDKVDPGERWRRSGVIREAHHEYKRLCGYAEHEIAEKERSLKGVLIPWSRQRNEMNLLEAGFVAPHIFWANTCFVGWAVYK